MRTALRGRGKCAPGGQGECDSTARARRTAQGAIRLRIHFSGTNMDTRLW